MKLIKSLLTGSREQAIIRRRLQGCMPERLAAVAEAQRILHQG